MVAAWQELAADVDRDPDLFIDERDRRRLVAFAARMVATYEVSPHILRLVEALEWAVRTPSARLIVTLPPRHSKSLHVSENLPAWYLGNHPDHRVIAASHTQRLANTFSRRVRNKIAHPRYPFPHVKIAGDKAAVEAWDIEGTVGGYFAVGVGGAPAGMGANLIAIDDPIKNAADAESQTVRDALWEWYREDIRTRLEPGGSIVVTATRWHEDDLTGRLLEAQATGGEQWRHLHLPAIDAQGEALWPDRWPLAALEALRGAVGTRAFESLYQGAPSVVEGNVWKRVWWRFWQPVGQTLPPVRVKVADNDYRDATIETIPAKMDKQIQSWDMAFKDTKSGSFVVGQVLGRSGANVYLLDQQRAHLAFPETLAAVRTMTTHWPQTQEKLVEDKANGPAVIATLKNEIAGMIPVTPEGGKESRANAVAWQIEAGNVYLPHPMIAPWVWDFIEEASNFPNAKHDDQVDAMSQALVRLTAKKAAPRATPGGTTQKSTWA